MTADQELNSAGWATLRDRDYLELIQREVRCLELFPDGPDSALNSERSPRREEYEELLWQISQLVGSIYECPQCHRLLWKKSSDEWFRVYSLEPGAIVVPEPDEPVA